MPFPATTKETFTGSRARAVAGVRIRSSVRSVPTAPLNPAGLPSSGTGRTEMCALSLVTENRSSWLKNCSASGTEYCICAGEIVSSPLRTGKAIWCATNRSYQMPATWRLAAMPTGAGCG